MRDKDIAFFSKGAVTERLLSGKIVVFRRSGVRTMPEPKAFTAPNDPASPNGETANWNPVPDNQADAISQPTIDRTVLSTPGPALPEHRTISEATEQLRGPISGLQSLENLPNIPGYRIESILGKGGMGTVYKAIDLELPRTVALKIIYPLGRDIFSIQGRFEREIRALVEIEHPNIVPIYCAGNWHGFPYFTMKYVSGGSLNQHLDRFKDAPEDCARLMSKVARAMQALHNARVIHRDLKPLNILLHSGDEPMVADFGLAKWLTDTESEFSIAGAALGTKQYMSPEQTCGNRTELSPACDIWAMGITLYELLAGQRPFDEQQSSDIFERIRHSEPDPLPNTVAPELATIVSRCLAKHTQDRYQNASDLADDLERWLAGEKIETPIRLFSPPKPKTRSWPVAVAMAALIGLIAVPAVIMSLRPAATGTDPITPPNGIARTPIAERMKLGETVLLIGETGLPLEPWNVLPGFNGAPVLDEANRCMVTAADITFVELVREPLPLPYRLEADVAVESSLVRSQNCYGAIYVGRKVTPIVDGRKVHTFAIFKQMSSTQFEMGKSLVKDYVVFGTGMIMNDHLSAISDQGVLPVGVRIDDMVPRVVSADERKELRWHKFEITVGEESIEPSWDWSKPGAPVLVKDVQADLLRARLPGPAAPPNFGPGLGICVSRADVWYRNVRLVPISKNPQK